VWLSILLFLATGVAQAGFIAVDAIPGGTIDDAVAVNVGERFDVDVLVEDVSDLAGFQFELRFDPAVLTAVAVSSGNLFGVDTFPIDDTMGTDLISFAEVSLAFGGVDIVGQSLLATVSFDAAAKGTSALSLGNVVFADSLGDEIPDIAARNATATVTPAMAVAEPALLPLLLTGLMIVNHRRKKGRHHACAAPKAGQAGF
jgi:general secretion pathway protein D